MKKCEHQNELPYLDCLYSPSHWSKSPPNHVIDDHMTAVQQCFRRIKECVPVKFDVPYGDTERQKVDIWGDEDKSQKAVVLFHGGYWVAEDRKDLTAPVKPLVDNGYVVACVGYEYATGGQLLACVKQAAKALQFLQMRWSEKKLAAGGFCAGAHLVCSALRFLPADHLYRKLILISMICKLQELPQTYIGRDISLTVEDAEELSIKSLRNFNGSVLIIYGSMDTPNFIRQNNELVEVLRHSGLNVTLKVVDNEDHFSLNHSFADSSSAAMKAVSNFLDSE
ncbi:unnamed protein product [Enterobius vermicularis]|uniref:Abhydrolase_3 domain-containing protein n=1 Tax=Enterobius vermicularis TaxID=51028 RepID=A0A0N4UWN2_ENTVE|nr:unnamed protein product [Enterobius vermicularis]